MRSVPVRTPLVIVLALALVAAACSGGDDDGAAVIDIANNSYEPSDPVVTSGASVTWTNHDDVPHTVTFRDDQVAGSGQLDRGESFTATFDEPGTYDYVCTVHPEMTATITVTG